MKIEFELRQMMSFNQGFDPAGKIRREHGRYFLNLDADNPDDKLQFMRLFERDAIKFDGQPAKQLAAFDEGFGSPEMKTLFADLRRCQEGLPALAEEAEARSAEAVVIKAAMDENTDIGRTDALFAELKKKESGAELAKVKADTAARRIAEIEKTIRASISGRKKREAERLKAELAPVVARFNAEIEVVYSKFLSVANELLPRIAECESGYSPGINYASPAVSIGDGQKLKTLRAVPQLIVRPSGLLFSLRDLK